MLKDEIIQETNAFIKRTGMNQTDFGWQVMRDVAFVGKLRKGLDIRVSTVDKLRKFMREYKGPEKTDAA